MSRIGRAPITVPAGVEVKVDGQHVSVKGPKGALEMNVAPTMKVEVEAGVAHVTRPNDDKMNRSLHGLTRTLINNMVVGVSEGFSKTLEVNGVGYRASKEGKNLVLNVGYSHQVIMPETEDITDRCSQPQPDHCQGYRQAEGRPVCSRSSWQASSRAVQGQGHQV